MSTLVETHAASAVWCQARLAYDDETAALEFLTTTFGMREVARKPNPDGSLLAWLAFGKSTLMIGRSGVDRHNLYSPLETGKPTAEMNVGVDDIDAHFRCAITAGVTVTTPLQDAPFGMRHYEAIDPEGHGWHFMKPLQDVKSGKRTEERLELRLVYADERAAADFLYRAFGLKEQARIDNPDGSFMAWLVLGEAVVMISRADAAERQFSPRETARPTAMLNLRVDWIDAHYRRAVAEGARIVSELELMPWGFRRYEALDPEGHRWHIMQELPA